MRKTLITVKANIQIYILFSRWKQIDYSKCIIINYLINLLLVFVSDELPICSFKYIIKRIFKTVPSLNI